MHHGLAVSATPDVSKTHASQQNHLNPFNPGLAIRSDLGQTSTTALDVRNVVGDKIMEQNYRTINAGRYNQNIDMNQCASTVHHPHQRERT